MPPIERWPIGGLFETVHHLSGLGCAIDMRHDDAERAIVQRSRGDRVFAVRHARDRRDAGIERRRQICAQASSDITPCSMSRNSQSNPATAMALAISTLRVMRTPTPSDNWPCSSFSRATLRTVAGISVLL